MRKEYIFIFIPMLQPGSMRYFEYHQISSKTWEICLFKIDFNCVFVFFFNKDIDVIDEIIHELHRRMAEPDSDPHTRTYARKFTDENKFNFRLIGLFIRRKHRMLNSGKICCNAKSWILKSKFNLFIYVLYIFTILIYDVTVLSVIIVKWMHLITFWFFIITLPLDVYHFLAFTRFL